MFKKNIIIKKKMFYLLAIVLLVCISGCGKKEKKAESESIFIENRDEQSNEESDKDTYFDETDKEKIQVEIPKSEEEIQVEVPKSQEDAHKKQDTLDTNKDQETGNDSTLDDATSDETTEDESPEDETTETSSGWGPIYKP